MNGGFTNKVVTGGALLGTYGGYKSVFDSVNWIQFNDACTCADTSLIPITLNRMVS
jgi:hypothetical protein